MKPIAIIQARMGSERFPGKVMAEVGGKPILRHVYDRVTASDAVRFAVVATDEDSYQIAKYCRREGILHYYGECEPRARMLQAAGAYSAEWFYRVCADCPLIDPSSFDLLCNAVFSVEPNCSCRYAAYRRPDGTPAIRTNQGLPELVSRTGLQESLRESCEHVTAGLYEQPNQCIWLEHPCDEHNTVDTPEDLERLAPRILAASGIEQAAMEYTQ